MLHSERSVILCGSITRDPMSRRIKHINADVNVVNTHLNVRGDFGSTTTGVFLFLPVSISDMFVGWSPALWHSLFLQMTLASLLTAVFVFSLELPVQHLVTGLPKVFVQQKTSDEEKYWAPTWKLRVCERGSDPRCKTNITLPSFVKSCGEISLPHTDSTQCHWALKDDNKAVVDFLSDEYSANDKRLEVNKWDPTRWAESVYVKRFRRLLPSSICSLV